MKIALCLTGKTGLDKFGKPIDLSITYNSYKKHLFDKYDVDLYWHTWGFPFNELEKLYDPQIYVYETPKVELCSLESRFQSIKSAIELVKGDYDLIMVSRFDITISEIDFATILNKFTIQKWAVDNLNAYLDFWFIAPKKMWLKVVDHKELDFTKNPHVFWYDLLHNTIGKENIEEITCETRLVRTLL